MSSIGIEECFGREAYEFDFIDDEELRLAKQRRRSSHVREKIFVDDASIPNSFAVETDLSGSKLFRVRNLAASKCFESELHAGTRMWRLGCDCGGFRRRNGAMVTRSMVSRLWAALAGASIAK